MKELIEKLKQKDQKALAKLITYVENNEDTSFIEELPSSGSKIIGITGSPGAGKSSLVDAIITKLREAGKTVGIIAIDPSSPFTGGAFLGDRIRMKKHFLDDGVFIRSMGSGNSLGGLNESIFDVIKLMDTFGFDYILIETVGAGQSEIDVVFASDVVILVLSPGNGDEIQLLKAGIMEIGDIYVINKADLDGANSLKVQLEYTLSFSNVKKPIIETIATSGVGVDKLVESINDCFYNFSKNGELKKRLNRRIKKHAETIVLKKVKHIINSKETKSVSSLVTETIKSLCNMV
ncbi:LAO/AO transport system kinase [Thermosipho japonicus]|uniref:LAO/AO transport system kinase n=1 Tax=Thermosipho japonicus TaxID=90323 RepID=A0A841GQW5_9BACT|nr:methylmalonyl Co-A mutase-associated GTPase MeaB [Thermosipho japonicus]MBB6062039.1 LAO/AO transport system kinase [Thermosipho japonicus]